MYPIILTSSFIIITFITWSMFLSTRSVKYCWHYSNLQQNTPYNKIKIHSVWNNYVTVACSYIRWIKQPTCLADLKSQRRARKRQLSSSLCRNGERITARWKSSNWIKETKVWRPRTFKDRVASEMQQQIVHNLCTKGDHYTIYTVHSALKACSKQASTVANSHGTTSLEVLSWQSKSATSSEATHVTLMAPAAPAALQDNVNAASVSMNRDNWGKFHSNHIYLQSAVLCNDHNITF